MTATKPEVLDPCAGAVAVPVRENLVAAFMAYLTHERNDSPHTVKAYRRDVERLEAYCGEHLNGWTWATIDKSTVRAFLAGLSQDGLGRRSTSRLISTLRVFYRFLFKRYEIENLVFAHFRLPKYARRLANSPSARQMTQLFSVAEKRIQKAIVLWPRLEATRDLAML